MDAYIIEGIGDEVLFALAGVVVLLVSSMFQSLAQQRFDSFPQASSLISSESLGIGPAYTNSSLPNAAQTEAPPLDVNDHSEPSDDADARNTAQESNYSKESDPTPFNDSFKPEQPSVGITEVEIRLKYLNDTERTVTCSLATKIGTFKNRFFPEEVREKKIIRLITCGKLLNDEERALQDFGLNETNNILHVQISTSPSSPQGTQQRDSDEPRQGPPPVATQSAAAVLRFEANITSLAYLVLGAMLMLFWYVHFQYRNLFTNSATTALVGISGLFFVFILAPSQPIQLQTYLQQMTPEL